jgi:hypothetical protein
MVSGEHLVVSIALVRWVMAIEAPDPGSTGRAAQGAGRVHAYDIIEARLAHALGVEYTVKADLMWGDAAPGPRCQHCLEIVGQEGPSCQ